MVSKLELFYLLMFNKSTEIQIEKVIFKKIVKNHHGTFIISNEEDFAQLYYIQYYIGYYKYLQTKPHYF